MKDFNDIGISRQLDWPRIKKLLTIGLVASLLHFIGDMLLGWGVEDEALTGLARMLSAYTGTPDGGIFAAALLGLFGMTLEGLCYFGVYRLIAARSPAYAHRYRAGIFGYVIFGTCGFHVPVCAITFLAKHGVADGLLSYMPPTFFCRMCPVLDLLPAPKHHADQGLCQGAHTLSAVGLHLLRTIWYADRYAPECFRQPAFCQRPVMRMDRPSAIFGCSAAC